jgi:hypothetical protein
MFVYAIGREVFDLLTGSLVQVLHSAFAAQEYAAAVNAGEIQVERRAA